MSDYMDKLTPEQRHKAMSRIRSKDTSIEVKLRRALWHKGYRYRKNYKFLPGTPDIVLTKYKIAIFCDSSFFHGRDWSEKLYPRLQKCNNKDFWIKKIKRNMERDKLYNLQLFGMGWTVIRFWDDEINKNLDYCINVIEEYIFDYIIGDYY